MERGPKEGHVEKGSERGPWKGVRKWATIDQDKARSQRWHLIHSGTCTLKLGASPTKSSGVREVLVFVPSCLPRYVDLARQRFHLPHGP